MSALLGDNQDWRAMREWLINDLATAKRLSGKLPAGDQMRLGLEAQAYVLSAALDFMDERERQALRGPQVCQACGATDDLMGLKPARVEYFCRDIHACYDRAHAKTGLPT